MDAMAEEVPLVAHDSGGLIEMQTNLKFDCVMKTVGSNSLKLLASGGDLRRWFFPPERQWMIGLFKMGCGVDREGKRLNIAVWSVKGRRFHLIVGRRHSLTRSIDERGSR